MVQHRSVRKPLHYRRQIRHIDCLSAKPGPWPTRERVAGSRVYSGEQTGELRFVGRGRGASRIIHHGLLEFWAVLADDHGINRNFLCPAANTNLETVRQQSL